MGYADMNKASLAETAGQICKDGAVERLKEAITGELKGQIPMDDPKVVGTVSCYVAASVFASMWLDVGPELTDRNAAFSANMAHLAISAAMMMEIRDRRAKKGGL